MQDHCRQPDTRIHLGQRSRHPGFCTLFFHAGQQARRLFHHTLHSSLWHHLQPGLVRRTCRVFISSRVFCYRLFGWVLPLPTLGRSSFHGHGVGEVQAPCSSPLVVQHVDEPFPLIHPGLLLRLLLPTHTCSVIIMRMLCDDPAGGRLAGACS